MSRNEYCPDYLVLPGEVLKEHLEHAGLTQAELAERASLPARTIDGIIDGELSITTDIAKRLENVLNRLAYFWLNLEEQCQADKKRLNIV